MSNVRPNARHDNRIPELDYLRGLAALSVLIFHYLFKGPTDGLIWSPSFGLLTDVAGYGYLGVNLFFIISGFVIAMSLKGMSVFDFLKARAIRLLPAMWVCATVTAISITVLSPQVWPMTNWLASLTLIPEWFGSLGVDGAYWSLRVEVQFYIAVGLFIALGRFKLAPVAIGIWLAASAANLLFPIWRLDFLLCLAWAPYLCAGILFYNWYATGLRNLTGFGLIVSFVLCVCYGYKSAAKDGYEIPWVSCLIVIILFAVFATLCGRKTRVKATAMSQILGEITYPVYLLHQTIGYLIFNAAIPSFVNLQGGVRLLVIIGVSFIAIGIAYALQVTFIRRLDSLLRIALRYKRGPKVGFQ